jgi:hypothetical protein
VVEGRGCAVSGVPSFEVTVKGKPDWGRVVNAHTRGKAKSEYWHDVVDAWPDLPFTAVRVRKLGKPVTSRQFERNAEYRGMPGVKCGQAVKVGSARGVIVGHNSSANFDVLFDLDSPKYAGLKLNVHPSEVVLVEGGAL